MAAPESVFGTADLDTLVGQSFADPAFGSTTASKSVADGFAAQNENAAIIEIVAPVGTQGIWVPSVGVTEWNESEFILPRGSRYDVVAVDSAANPPIVSVRLVNG